MYYFFSTFKKLLIVNTLINFVLRLILVFHPITQSKFTLLELFKIFFVGFINDTLVFTIASSFLFIYLIFLSNSKFKKPWGYILFIMYLSVFLYIYSGKSILNEYGGILPELGMYFVGLKTLFIGALLFFPKFRKIIRIVIYSISLFIFILILIQNAVSEFFFWNEFGLKYNFIAVDYLVYTNAVIGNIIESYPVVPIFTSVGIVTFLFTFYLVKKTKIILEKLPTVKEKIRITLAYSLLLLFSFILIPQLSKLENSKNVYVNELQANGINRFYLAFMNSELDYYTFYSLLPDSKVHDLIKNEIKTNKIKIIDSLPSKTETKKNVVLITIESLSAEFMKMYGNEENLTPFLDSLALNSLNFSNLYATGNRTVRGLEAVTLCIPPTPGESVVKRVDNKNKFCTASIFKSKGYLVKYLYGGDSYFDNMKDFFEGNGYEVIDKNNFKADEITFSNIWGVCDEDMAKKAISVMNEEAKTGKPFFNHWMTVSNHRPFTYPNGKIDISNDSKSRYGGVKYTDYSLKQFFKMAEKQSWYKNTVFVIVADHCASSSGKTELPLDKYRIPGFIFSPNFILPQNNNILMSQIDLMPTLFNILSFQYENKFYGKNVLDSNYNPRAFIATYQDLGFIKNDILTILSPVRKEKQYDLKVIVNEKLPIEYQLFYEENQKKRLNNNTLDLAKAYYQSSAYSLKNKLYDN